MLTDWAIKLVAKWSYEYIKMSCAEGRCYGVLAVSFCELNLQVRRILITIYYVRFIEFVSL